MADPKKISNHIQRDTQSRVAAGAEQSRRAARLRPATRSLRDVLAERGPLTGPVTDAGTRALREVRGERTD